jgi:integrase
LRPGSLTLSALGDAVRQRRLAHNPARPSVLPRPPAAERRIWTPEQAARFLRHCHRADPFMADLCEVLIGTGMRKGEALGLHWKDVHLPELAATLTITVGVPLTVVSKMLRHSTLSRPRTFTGT